MTDLAQLKQVIAVVLVPWGTFFFSKNTTWTKLGVATTEADSCWPMSMSYFS